MLKSMTIERAVYAFAGFMILLSLALTQWVSPYFVWFTAFCPAAIVFKAMGLKPAC